MERTQLPLFRLDEYESEIEPPALPDPTVNFDLQSASDMIQLILPGYEDLVEPSLEQTRLVDL